MLPIATDNGARLAAILPSCISSIAKAAGRSATRTLETALGAPADSLSPQLNELLASLPQIRASVVIVVDGLGTANLNARAAYARTLHSIKPKRIETVVPSTTGAALSTLTTGRLPGEHGLVGYKIRHPELGLVTTLKDWQGITDPHAWQRATPLFHLAGQLDAHPVTIGRPAHATGGLTNAILSGARYVSGQTIAERFAEATQIVRLQQSNLIYLYIDELDKAAHTYGWQSEQWSQRLEQFDRALDGFLLTLPRDVGVVITADHGIVDVEPHKQTVLDADPELMKGVAQIGGEPRMRSLYLDETAGRPCEGAAEDVAHRVQQALGKRAWVGTRDEAIRANWFGTVDEAVASRLGHVLVAARGQHAFTLTTDSAAAREMVGQHGSVSDEERGIPLGFGGAYADSTMAAVVTRASLLVPGTASAS